MADKQSNTDYQSPGLEVTVSGSNAAQYAAKALSSSLALTQVLNGDYGMFSLDQLSMAGDYIRQRMKSGALGRIAETDKNIGAKVSRALSDIDEFQKNPRKYAEHVVDGVEGLTDVERDVLNGQLRGHSVEELRDAYFSLTERLDGDEQLGVVAARDSKVGNYVGRRVTDLSIYLNHQRTSWFSKAAAVAATVIGTLSVGLFGGTTAYADDEAIVIDDFTYKVLIKQFDEDGDGRLIAREYQNLRNALARVKKYLLDNYDDGDNVLSTEELEKIMNSAPEDLVSEQDKNAADF
ncbi:hypothetical protein KY360_05965, partial [Candidatus Woesearchaeota archaeon]|nr:hypothetical protein [Candidatus Woesearchaeota archaeon]